MPFQEGKHSQLLKLIEEALSKPLSFEESHDIQNRLADLLLSLAESDLYEDGAVFRRWLDDWDIRQHDDDYAEALTRRLRTLAKRYSEYPETGEQADKDFFDRLSGS